jgi:hypothetical protein
VTDFDRISEADSGSFLVTTYSASRYVLDLEARSVTRHTGVGLGVSKLRRDGDAVPLHQLIRCAVGKPMVLLIAVADDPATFTTRTSSEVESIERVGKPDSPLAPGDTELATLEAMIGRARLGLVGLADRGMAIYGPRKALATPVLKALAARASNAGWFVIPVAPSPDAQAALLEDARRLGAQLGVSEEATTGEVEGDLEALLLNVASALQREGVALMVAVDSVERVRRDLIYTLILVQQFAALHALPAYVFAAGGPRLPSILAGDGIDILLDFRIIRAGDDPGPTVGA